LRKALFAVMLVGASFAGGAVVNGPGLRWAQAMILSHLNGNDEDETSDDEDAEANGPVQGPLAPIPSEPLAPQGGAAPAVADARPESTTPPAAMSKAETPSQPEAKPLPGERPRPRATDDAEIALAKVASPLPDGGPPPLEPLEALPPLSVEPGSADKEKDKTKAKEPAWSDRPGSAPAAEAPARSFEPAPALEKAVSAAANSPSRPAASDWAAIRRKMVALGVSRYGIEGEPNGRVRFHCVIPLAGRRAVAQQFEAEGDDDLQAAEVALRRVALWRATENQGP
jgi:hypothetical protein